MFMDASREVRMELVLKYLQGSTQAFKIREGCEGSPSDQAHIKQTQPSVYTVTKLVEREEGL